MSVKIMGQVWDLDIPSNEQIVLLALADHADHEGGSIWPSNALIAWKCGCSEDTVSRMKKKLTERGILITTSAETGKVKQHRIDTTKGTKKAPFQRTSPPQFAGGSRQPPPATETDNPPQSFAARPPAELCGTNHQGTANEPSTAGQARPPSKKVSEASPEHPKFMALWKAEFEKRFNRAYKFTARDGKAVKNLLNEPNATAQDLMDVALAAWKTADQNPRKAFYCGKLVEIHQIESQWNKIQDEISPTTRQPAHVSVIEPPHQERHINSALD